MQSVALYGRLVARAIVSGIHNEFQLKSPREIPKDPLQLVTGHSGFSKTLSPNTLRKWNFGDDAYFIARNKVADVIGKHNSVLDEAHHTKH